MSAALAEEEKDDEDDDDDDDDGASALLLRCCVPPPCIPRDEDNVSSSSSVSRGSSPFHSSFEAMSMCVSASARVSCLLLIVACLSSSSSFCPRRRHRTSRPRHLPPHALCRFPLPTIIFSTLVYTHSSHSSTHSLYMYAHSCPLLNIHTHTSSCTNNSRSDKISASTLGSSLRAPLAGRNPKTTHFVIGF